MTQQISVVVGDYPHTTKLKTEGSFGGVEAIYPQISPVHDAFDAMVRTQQWDVCEMAIGAFLQAHEANKPLVLLPAVMVGGFHHRNLIASPVAAPASPAELPGRRIGVRSYSQTTGLWVRGWLADEYGLGAGDVEWVTTEGSHSDSYDDPDYVVRTENSIIDELRSGGVAAAVLGPANTPEDMSPLLPDWRERSIAWSERHGTVPINHMVTATREFAETNADALRQVYRTLRSGIENSAAPPKDGLPSPIRAGLDQVRDAVCIAAGYALDQGLISRPVTDVDALFAFAGDL